MMRTFFRPPSAIADLLIGATVSVLLLIWPIEAAIAAPDSDSQAPQSPTATIAVVATPASPGAPSTTANPIPSPWMTAGLTAVVVATLGMIAVYVARTRWPARARPPTAGDGPAPPPLRVEQPPAAPAAALTSDSPPPPGIAYLRSQEHTPTSVYWQLSQLPLTIGRHPDCALVIDERFRGWRTVSLRHARLEQEGADFIVVDTQSENGIYINGQRTGVNILRDGCTLSFGQVHFTFHRNLGRSS